LFNTACILVILCSFVYFFKEQILSLFTSDQKVLAVANSIVWMISFNTFPDVFKGMLKGVIKALGVQSMLIPINLVGHWCINLTLQWYLAIHLNMGIFGQWVAKLILEIYILVMYYHLCQSRDWEKISNKSYENQEKETKLNDHL